jgi:glucose/arabinose dehydrogenase
MNSVRVPLAAIVLAITTSAMAATAPGVSVEKIADTSGFLSSIAFDRNGTLFYSVLDGSIYRLSGATSVKVATVPTAVGGNEGLLGIALLPDGRFASHSNRPDHTADVISIVDPGTGSVQELAALICNHGQPCSPEHHGGNVAIGPDGSVFVGIGDYALFTVAQDPTSPGGKIMRVFPDGTAKVYALGFRNPFGIAYDSVSGKVIVVDNGPGAGDEVDIVAGGDNCGWPATYGNQPNFDGFVPPIYVFRQKVAPTGVTAVGPFGMLGHGIVVASYNTKALYYFASLDASMVPDPVPLVIGETDSIISVAQDANGEIYFGTPNAISRLVFHLPRRESARH